MELVQRLLRQRTLHQWRDPGRHGSVIDSENVGPPRGARDVEPSHPHSQRPVSQPPGF